MSSGVLGELVLLLGVKADTFTVKDFARAIGDIPLSVAGALGSLAGLSFGFVEMTKNVLDMTTGLRLFTAETGLNTRELQQWQKVAEQVGLPRGLPEAALLRLSKMLAGWKQGEGVGQAEALAMGKLGIPINQAFGMNAYQLMNRIQAGTAGMNKSEAARWVAALTGSEQMMGLFGVSQKERMAMTPWMTAGQEQAMAGVQKELARFNELIMTDFVKVMTPLAPAMVQLAKALTPFVEWIGNTAATGANSAASVISTYNKRGWNQFADDLVKSTMQMGGLAYGYRAMSMVQNLSIHGVTGAMEAGESLYHQTRRAVADAVAKSY